MKIPTGCAGCSPCGVVFTSVAAFDAHLPCGAVPASPEPYLEAAGQPGGSPALFEAPAAPVRPAAPRSPRRRPSGGGRPALPPSVVQKGRFEGAFDLTGLSRKP